MLSFVADLAPAAEVIVMNSKTVPAHGAATVVADDRSIAPIHPEMDLTSHTIFRLIVLQNFIARPFTLEIGRAHHLSLTDWRVLFIVGARPGVTSTEIVDGFGFEKMALSRSIARLADQERLTRSIDPADRRRVELRLTPAGTAFLAEVTPTALSREAILDTCLTPAEHQTLDAILDKIIAAVRS
jgi:DNA-binding MarR family transcriptional regulator